MTDRSRRWHPGAGIALILLTGCGGEESATPVVSPAPPAPATQPAKQPAEQPPAKQPPAPATQPAKQPAEQPPAKQPAAKKPAADSTPGVAVGAEAPKFELPDQLGKPRSLAGLLAERPVALVFYRSADW